MKMLLVVVACIACVCDGFSVPLTQADKDVILQKHNELRSKIARGIALPQSRPNDLQPTAANMRRMEWSIGIEAKANEHARLQKYAHSSSTFRTYNDGKYNGYHGENVAWFWTSRDYGWKSTSAASAVDGWITEEEKFYHFETGKKGQCYGKPLNDEKVQCGHYTQGVWADSYLLGCASTYEKKNGDIDKKAVIIICQYNGGNYEFNGVFSVYEKGKACQKCPSGWQTCNSGLCSRGSAPGPAPAPAPAPAPPAPAPAPPAPAPAPTPAKKDVYSDCEARKRQKQCFRVKFRDDLEKNCAKTCAPGTWICSKWSSRGRCNWKKWKDFMKRNCASFCTAGAKRSAALFGGETDDASDDYPDESDDTTFQTPGDEAIALNAAPQKCAVHRLFLVVLSSVPLLLGFVL